MTQDEIIRMAREAGGVDIACNGWTSWIGTQTTEFLERFATLAFAAGTANEREACAKACDEISDKYRHPEDTAERVASEWCAAAIRARGEK